MRARILLVSVFLLGTAAYHSSDSHAQSGADSVAVMDALARSVEDQVLAIGSRAACYHAQHCTEEELSAATRLLQVLSTTAGIPLRDVSVAVSPPPCPAQGAPASEDTGFLLYVGVPQIQQDRAVVAVATACTWSTTARDGISMVGEDYTIERRDGGWVVTGRRSTWRS